MDENTKLIKCRKCGGNHLTIKCGKEKQVLVEETSTKPKIEENFNKKENKLEKEYKREYNGKSHKVKILNLPSNFEHSEIAEFAKDWGHVIKINTKNYDNSSIAVIEFKYEREAEYFIEALDNTPFEHYILKVTKIEE
jgi:RNA recognition motif-containing protein